MKENMVSIFLPRGRKNEENFVIVSVNGRSWKIMKGVQVQVPDYVAEVLENSRMMAETARYIGQSGAEGVKLHLLHVLRNTDLAAEWQAGRVQTLELEEYISILELCLRNLPPETVIHRLTGDGAKRDLLAPLWSGDKKRVLNAIHQTFLRDNLIQGSTL